MKRPLGPTDLKRLHRGWRRRTTQRVALVLDDVSTTFNIGAIVRSAAAYGVDHVFVTASSTMPDHPKAGRASKGTERYLNWTIHPDGASAVAEAAGAGYRTVAIELVDGADPVFDVDLGGDVALVVGHEDRGISPAALDRCDTCAYLPLLGRVGSLNVAAATAVALAEARRQGWSR